MAQSAPTSLIQIIQSNVFHFLSNTAYFQQKLPAELVFFAALRAKTIALEELQIQGEASKIKSKDYIFPEMGQLLFPEIDLPKLYQSTRIHSYQIRSLIEISNKLLQFDPFVGIAGIVWKDFRLSNKAWVFCRKIIKRFFKNGIYNRYEELQTSHQLIMQIIQVARGDFETNIIRGYNSFICFSDAFMIEVCKNQRSRSHKKISIGFVVLPKRVPITEEGKLKGFQVEQCIELFPHYQRNNTKMIDVMRDHIVNTFKGDHDQYDCFLPDYVLTHIPLHKRKHAAFYSLSSIVDIKENEVTGQMICIPKKFQLQQLEPQYAKLYKRDKLTLRYTYEGEFMNVKDKYKRASEQIVETVSDEKGAEQLLKLINSIPSLKFKLTPEQQRMISTPNNLLCLGRSGTGKTTSSALRLFSTDVFYKYMEELKRFKEQNPDKLNQHFKVDPNFLEKPTNLKLVFVTFSPVLTNEVKKFYEETKRHFIDQLLKVREKQMAHMQVVEEEEEKQISYSETASQATDYTQQAREEEKKVMEAYLELEGDVFQDDHQVEKQMQLPHSMDALSSDHYPLFVTVRRLIYMMDASLENSFFSRNNEGGIVGMDSGVEWHNENRGVFMINQYYKQQKDYDEKIKKLGTKLMNLDEEMELEDFKDIDDEEDCLYEEEQAKSSYASFNVSAALGAQVNTNSAQSQYSLEGRQLSFEVDFETFRTRFWPKVASWSKLAPLVVWTEIFSVIKGSAESSNYRYSALPFWVYVGQDSRSSKKLDSAKFLFVNEKVTIYQIYMHYEKWKQSMQAYDFNDVVNHVIVQSRNGLKAAQMIHFLMVDEVQDLTPNILMMLTNITERNIFFCGDTAQTIAKGVGFRFYDLKTVFRRNEFITVPSVLQLAKNFRSHSKILDLANSVVSLIEVLFPKTIDKLLKEVSDLDGPKPIFIDPATDEQLRRLLFSRSLANLRESGDNSKSFLENSAKPQFGCQSVIIVRDQESKAKVPEFLQNMLCLTVYEAKGLEFEDVILFNFFEDSKAGNQWLLLRDIETTMQVKKKRMESDFLNFESLDIMEEDYEEEKESTTNYIEERQLQKGEALNVLINENNEEVEALFSLNRPRGQVYRQYAQLCTELKFLYVAITRPKNTLIVYDLDSKHRKPAQEFWQSLKLIHVVSKDMLSDHSLLPMEVQSVFVQHMSLEETKEEDWRLQGIMLFKKKFYQSAITCFKNSGDQNLVIRCQAYQNADRAQVLLGESESKVIQSRNKVFKKSEKNQMKKEAKDLKKEAFEHLELAGDYFKQIGMSRHAAQCYCSAHKLDRAATMFESLVDYGQSAECYMKTKNYRKAAEYYAKAGLFANAFECYERLQDWEGLLLCLSHNKVFFKKEERESLIEKYFPIALNQLYHIYSNLDPTLQGTGIDEENRGKFQEMKIKMKFQKSISVIKEDAEEEDEEEEDSEEEREEEQDPEKQAEYELEQEEKQQREEVKETVVATDKSVSLEQSFEIIDTSTKPKQKKFNMYEYQDDAETIRNKEERKLSEDEDIEVIEEGHDDNNLESLEKGLQGQLSKRSDQFEVLSCLDPDDEFLQNNKSVSIIESIVSRNSSQFSVISSKSSEFSIIGNSKLHSIIQSVYSLDQSNISSHQNFEMLSQRGDSTLDLAANDILDVSSQYSVGAGSAMSLLNSSKFSTIQNERDSYAEDIVMQKIIFYVSLFSDDVKSRLQEMRSRDTLGHLDLKFDESSGFDNQFMFIDLDGINQELLYLILDTLEHYELFRLCLIICNRYQLKNKVPRYLISIGNKYSNLKNFRLNFLTKSVNLNDIQAQQTYSLIAHEAMHNVLSLLEKDFLRLDEQGKDSINLRDNCFQHLFLQGFWRKLVFLMDVDSSLQLCKSMNDRESFKLLYLIYRCGIKDGTKIRDILQATADNADHSEFEQLLKKDVNKQTKVLAQEVVVADLMASLDRALKLSVSKDQKIINSITPDIKKRNQEIINRMRKLITHSAHEEIPKKKKDYLEVKKILGLIAQMAAVQSQSTQTANYFIYGFDSKDFRIILELTARVLKLINTNSVDLITDRYIEKKSSEELAKIQREVLRVVMQPFGVHTVDGLPLFNQFLDEFCIVRRDSVIIKQVFDKHLEALQDFNNLILVKISQQLAPQYNINSILTAVVKQAYEKAKHSLDSNPDIKMIPLATPCDLNGLEYLLVPKQWVIDIVSARLSNFSLYIYKIEEEKFSSFSQRIIKYTTLQTVSKASLFYSRGLLDQYSHNQRLQANQVAKINRAVTHLLMRASYDRIPSVVDGIMKTFETKIKKAKLLIKEKNKYSLAAEHQLGKVPRNKIVHHSKLPKLSPNQSERRVVVLRLAFQYANESFKQINNQKELYYTQIIQAFRLFVIVDEYIYLLELLRAKKKTTLASIKKANKTQAQAQEAIKKSQAVQLINNTYNLLDVHAYISNNLWCQASASMYSFLGKAFDYVSFNDILSLLEGAFYRALFSHYIYAKSQKEGVLIPDYAMVHIEPNSNFQCQPRKQDKSKFEVIKVEYLQVELEKPKDLSMIEKGFFWIDIFLKVLNSDIEALTHEKLYFRLYNMMMTFMINTTPEEMRYQNKVVKVIEQVSNKFLSSGLDREFGKQCSMFINLLKNIDKFSEDLKSRGEGNLHKVLLFRRDKEVREQGGFVRVCTNQQYNKDTQTELIKQMDKAYYVEMQKLATHIQASNQICGKWKKIRARLRGEQQQTDEDKLCQDCQRALQMAWVPEGNCLGCEAIAKRHEEIRKSFEKDRKERQVVDKTALEGLKRQKYCIQIYDAIVSQAQCKMSGANYNELIALCAVVGRALELIEALTKQFMNASISKLVYNSLDLHYLKGKLNEQNERRDQFIQTLKNSITKSKIYEELMSSLQKQAEEANRVSKELEQKFNEWILKKAEPNIIELEKKQLNIRNKWETLVSFQKKKRIALRHLSRTKATSK